MAPKPTKDASLIVELNGVVVTEPKLAAALGIEPGTKVAWATATPSVGRHL